MIPRLTELPKQGNLISSTGNPGLGTENPCNWRCSAPESGAIFVSTRHSALAGGRGYKAGNRANNSACPVTGFQPPAASGVLKSSNGLVQTLTGALT